MVSLEVTFRSESFKEAEMTEKEFYQKEKEEFPKTSQQADEMADDVKVYSFDSELTCALQGLYVVKAAKMTK